MFDRPATFYYIYIFACLEVYFSTSVSISMLFIISSLPPVMRAFFPHSRAFKRCEVFQKFASESPILSDLCFINNTCVSALTFQGGWDHLYNELAFSAHLFFQGCVTSGVAIACSKISQAREYSCKPAASLPAST